MQDYGRCSWVVGYVGEKPITVKIKLENEVQIMIYTGFIKKV
ncbi:hypothetical protein J2Z42_001356 [Clostridium algifaecis]|uniref:Uncharacterized protein n=1 Tax=Clostridium algifaecis TaxID=1472040 RepID=A0ABS4KRM7_9CLOT|nr:hypothetical protein [Clostridium algifaecis]MBP2032682.1 hypothetical protein [Clostridium algifaecis]